MKAKTIAAYVHLHNAGLPVPEVPDERPGAYYVSAKDGERFVLLAGPWPTHPEALAAVTAVRAKALELDPRGHWYFYGTARLPDDDYVPIRTGKLNKFFPELRLTT